MYSNFKIKKVTGTYSDTIEALGFANLLNEIQSRLNIRRPKLIIEDKGLFYEIIFQPEISSEEIKSLTYFPIFQYVIRESKDSFNEPCFDYEQQRKLKKEKQELIQAAYKEFKGKEKAQLLKEKLAEIEKIYTEEKYISPQLDVYTQIATNNNFSGFEKLYQNISANKDHFSDIIKAILDYYSDKKIEINYRVLTTFETSVTALQIYNPNSGKGQNRSKASGAGAGGVKSIWISETMKVSGSITNMLCQPVKVGSSYDLKVVVPNFKKAEYSKLQQITLSFKKNIKGNTPLKVDILNLLIINKQLIENTEEYHNFKAKNVLSGLHSTYQKDLGQNKAVVNIAELQTPDFIEFNTEDEAKDWIAFLKEQIMIIGSIEELGDATQGLIAYRTFLTSSHFQSWSKFSFWYSAHIMANLSKGKYTLQIKKSSLDKFLNKIVMNNQKISEIISNDGFQKVATAIRNSTVVLQGAKSRGKKIDFEIRYGVSQELRNKSKTPEDLATYIGEFIGRYNAETARKAEINKAYRKPVRDNELNLFYSLLDSYSSTLIGALLASYGFSLTENDTNLPTEEVPSLIESIIEE